VTEFGSLNHSPGKRVLNNLKTICLRFWKVVVQRVASSGHNQLHRLRMTSGVFCVSCFLSCKLNRIFLEAFRCKCLLALVPIMFAK